ncbi:MAG TPA: hypothetical protein VM241_03000 [Candidatus Thermoplasmatota archaeon]|nr:hypothetical protein [Candidatus Thermoplasmatota archaeon]
MRVPAMAVVLAVALCLALPASAKGRSPSLDAQSAFDSLATQRAKSGAFDASLAPLLVEAAAAVHIDPAAWPDAAHPLLASLRPAGNGTLLEQVRSIHARAVSGHATPQDTAAVQASFANGQYGDLVLLNDDAWAILSLRALGVPATDDYLQAAAHHVAAQQDAGGGWSWRIGGAPSSDVTGMALVALKQANALPADAAASARAYLEARQNATGGYAEERGAPNCDSTVWAIRGLHAAGAPTPANAWAYLAGLHQPDGGFAYQPGQPSNPLCTAEVAALLGEWVAAGRDLSAYAGTTQDAPSPAFTALAAGLLLLAAVAAKRRA